MSLVKIDTMTGIADFHIFSWIFCEFSENRYIDRHSRLPCNVVDLLWVSENRYSDRHSRLPCSVVDLLWVSENRYTDRQSRLLYNVVDLI